ncbi:Bacterial Cytochrome Ubiquinol Oxidase [Pirellulimonas nuda]|uniref:Bacterial Cytochrome Ubiquinol Oxidase n=1 Tax=Pirellulimonas nuda TaxID=2528009 RepID=A0A518D5M1_9BACT|nr:c-type cytochrome [Pirellulimonas nuda]QDU86764.1 Bacterial Cytochrome Ubiquinol Oxidase [Pirellulimonas nuda]
MAFPYYPLQDYGPVMKGMVIGGLGIFHVYLAQFAIGGGVLLAYFQWLAGTGRLPLARRVVDGMFRVLVLVSFVMGALTGVAMWFTTIQVSPRTIGLMVDQFHWVWAIEWTFFALEVASGYAFYRCASRLDDRTRFWLLVVYAFAAWMSLFWINGILSWQLTPGGWSETGGVWAGFFNPTFWPSLLFRTLASLATAGLVGCLVINLAPGYKRSERRVLIHRAAHLLAPMALMPLAGAWFLMAMPADSRGWVMGGSIAMTLFFSLGVGASLLIGAYAAAMLVSRRLMMNAATASLLVALGFFATAGAEFVREGSRKPFTVRGALYSNSITPDEVAKAREVGLAAADPYPLADGVAYPTGQLELGAKTFRLQCSVCHTWDGANGLAHLAETWTTQQLRLNVAQLQRTKAFMPPFAGPAEEVEALAQWVRWRLEGAPPVWDTTDDPAVLRQITDDLDAVGTGPGIAIQQREGLQVDD